MNLTKFYLTEPERQQNLKIMNDNPKMQIPLKEAINNNQSQTTDAYRPNKLHVEEEISK